MLPCAWVEDVPVHTTIYVEPFAVRRGNRKPRIIKRNRRRLFIIERSAQSYLPSRFQRWSANCENGACPSVQQRARYPVLLQNADRALDSIALPVPAQIKLDAWLLEANREIFFI